MKISVPIGLSWVTPPNYQRLISVQLEMHHKAFPAITKSMSFTINELSCDVIAQGMAAQVFFGVMPMNTVNQKVFGQQELVFPAVTPADCVKVNYNNYSVVGPDASTPLVDVENTISLDWFNLKYFGEVRSNKMIEVVTTSKDSLWKAQYQGKYTGGVRRTTGGYWETSPDYELGLCWIEKPANACTGLTCDTKLAIDTDETHTSVSFQLDPYTLTNYAPCGTVVYEFSSELQTDPNDPLTVDPTYDLFSSGDAVFT